MPVKVGTHNHVKMKRLKRLLGVPLYRAVGILECLWLLCAECCDEGDIGKFSDDEIADYLEWDGDVSELVRCLSESGWTDPDESCRLVVHDWLDHCPEYIRERVRKRRARNAKPRKIKTYVRSKADNNGHTRDKPPHVPLIPNPTNPIPTSQSDAANGGPTDRLTEGGEMPDWKQVAAVLASLKAVRWKDAIDKLKDHQCTPEHALAVINSGKAQGYDIGGIVHRLKLAHPNMDPREGWPKTPPKPAVKTTSAADRERAANEAMARQIIIRNRGKKTEAETRTELAAAGLEWPK